MSIAGSRWVVGSRNSNENEVRSGGDAAIGRGNTELRICSGLLLPTFVLCVLLLKIDLASAVCTVGGTSTFQLPAVTFLRSYRAPFDVPTRVAVDSSGNVYVTDPGRRQIIVRAPNGRVLSRFDFPGRPVSIAIGAGGEVYVGDDETGSVTAFGADWHDLFQLGRGAGELERPNDIAVDISSGNVYVADSAAHLVRVYGETGTFLHSFGGRGRGEGEFNYPVAVFVDAAAQQVLVVDQLNYRVQTFDLNGNFLSCFGAQGSGAGRFNMPQGVSVDAAGRVYVADSLEGRLQVLDRNGGFVGYIGDFGETKGQLRRPIGMVIDPSNRLFIAAANNARLEVFGLDAFSDPETFLPAVVDVQPSRLDRAAPQGVIVSYIEVPGYSLGRILLDSVTANNVATTTTELRVADHDSNGVPDVRVEFDRTSLLNALPVDGAATVSVAGTLGTKQFEGVARIEVTTCSPTTKCPLGDADPQCNEAVCLPGVGCSVAPKPDGTGCEDGDACTVEDSCNGGHCEGSSLTCNDGNLCTDDACDPVEGCKYTGNTAPCDDGDLCTVADSCSDTVCGGEPRDCDDGSVCTDDGCDPASGCIHANNTVACDDDDACTLDDLCTEGSCRGFPRSCDDGNVCTNDACDAASGCFHVGNTKSCDDADPGSIYDFCDGQGTCRGVDATRNYALLTWPADRQGRGFSIDRHVLLGGDVCAETVLVNPSTRIDGDLVAWASSGRAITFDGAAQIAGDVVTGGGSIAGIDRVSVAGVVDQSGTAAQLGECSAALYRAADRRAELAARPPTPGFELGSIALSRRTRRDILLADGFTFIDLETIRLGPASTLALVGTDATEAIVVHVRGRMLIGQRARIETVRVPAERVAFIVDGAVFLYRDASMSGSISAADRVRMATGSTVDGAIFGGDVRLGPAVTINLMPFIGWQ